jgi:hypothetical protein
MVVLGYFPQTRVNTRSHQKVPPCLPRLAMMTLYIIIHIEATGMCAAAAGYTSAPVPEVVPFSIQTHPALFFLQLGV